jgi:hypothetical protein
MVITRLGVPTEFFSDCEKAWISLRKNVAHPLSFKAVSDPILLKRGFPR